MYLSVKKHEGALCNTDSDSDSLYDPREEQMEWNSHNENFVDNYQYNYYYYNTYIIPIFFYRIRL